jgi:transcriptional regulator with GAF, ATPase, and Fis domain
MTQSNDQPNDRRIDRQLRTIARRVNRLEDTQVTWGELNIEFDRLYDEVDDLKIEMNRRFDNQDIKIDLLNTKIDGVEERLNAKLDILIRGMTGMGQE